MLLVEQGRERTIRRFGTAVLLMATLAGCQKRQEAPAAPVVTAATAPAPAAPPPPVLKGDAVQTEVSVEGAGGTFLVPVAINDTITLKFTIDSGAADVSVPADVVSTLFRSGTITQDDFIGRQTYVLADGSTVPSVQFRIRSLKVGTLVLHDVVGSVADARGELLLGQSFLSRLSSWSFDNQRRVLSLKAAPGEAELATNAPNATLASEVSTQGAQTGNPLGADSRSTLETSAAAIAMGYLSAWSDSTDPDGQGIRPYYAESISFYGDQLSRDQLMAQKLQFARRWPHRSYVPRQDTIAVRCSDGHRCFVSGVVDWSASNNSGRVSAGTANFAMGLNDGLIELEGGSVISRR